VLKLPTLTLTLTLTLKVLGAKAALGGAGLEPFVSLIDGGRQGELFSEMEEYFYYAQLQHQGLSSMQERKVRCSLCLLLRACILGFLIRCFLCSRDA
jgi:hypothetical protein